MKITLKKIIKAFIPYGILKIFWYLKNNKDLEVLCNYLLHNKDYFPVQLAVVAVVKNESQYIREWIEYHKIVGVTKFYIYDDNSTDGLKEVLTPYIDSNDVVYAVSPYTDKGNWAPVYDDAIKQYKNECKWLAIIDADEFIVPVKRETITEVMNEIERRYKKMVSLAVHWVVYGYSGHKTKPNGLVIENYRKNDGVATTIKSIVNPRTVVKQWCHTHYHFFNKGGINEKGVKVIPEKYGVADKKDASIENIRINHYWTKSYEEFVEKIKRNNIVYAAGHGYENIPDYDPDYLSHNVDTIMEKYIPLLKEKQLILNHGIIVGSTV